MVIKWCGIISLSKIFHLILSHPLLLWRVNILFSLAVNCETGWQGINLGLISCDDMYFVSKSLVNDGNVLLHMKLIMRTILMIPHSQPTHSRLYIQKSKREYISQKVGLDSFVWIWGNWMQSGIYSTKCYLHDPRTKGHVCWSMGKFRRIIGHFALTVSLKWSEIIDDVQNIYQIT